MCVEFMGMNEGLGHSARVRIAGFDGNLGVFGWHCCRYKEEDDCCQRYTESVRDKEEA
ncbi:hypothetical protein Hanom_Chr17g01539531 [Helianthus anomalus]